MSTAPISRSPTGAAWSRDRVGALGIALLLGASLLLRLQSIHFGLPALNDPDELTFELGAIKMLSGPTLNPEWFGHPATTTMYVLAMLTAAVFGLGHLFGRFASVRDFADAIYADPSWVMLPGRIAMAIFAVATIYLTYRLAEQLFGRRAAWAAAALLAVNPVHITWSQIIRSDMMACFFMLLCMLAALRIHREDRWRDYVLAALWLAAATATKWPYALAALSVGGAVFLRMADAGADRRRYLLRLVLFGAMAIGFLLLISPYLLLDHQTALANMRGEAQTRHLGATGGAAWENAWWYVSDPLRKAFGIAGLALCALGTVVVARHREARAVLLPVGLGFAVVLCMQNLVWERWALALIPPLAIAGGACLSAMQDLFARNMASRQASAVAAATLVALLIAPALRAEGDARARLNDTRQLAAHWARVHVAPGSTVLLEHFGFDILSRPWHLLFPFGDLGCVDVREYLGGKVQLSTVQKGRGSRTNVDYGTVAAAKRDTCRSDYAILTQADRYAAESKAFPVEAAAYRELVAHGTVVATFEPVEGRIGGPVVRIVRFTR